jgi:hypothetical protein
MKFVFQDGVEKELHNRIQLGFLILLNPLKFPKTVKNSPRPNKNPTNYHQQLQFALISFIDDNKTRKSIDFPSFAVPVKMRNEEISFSKMVRRSKKNNFEIKKS